MSELKRHKRSDAIKWTATAIAFAFVAIVLVGVCLQAFGKGKVKPSESFKKDEQTEQTTPDDQSDAGLIVTPSEDKTGIKLNVRKAAANADGNDADTYTVTATVLPSYADDKSVDWSLAYAPVTFKDRDTNTDREVVLTDDENRFYFVGEDPSDLVNLMYDSVIMKKLKWIKANSDPSAFVTVTPMSDGAATATVKCLDGFRQQMLLTVTSRSNASLKAVCTLDHYAYVFGAIFTINNTIYEASDITASKGLTYEYPDNSTTRSVKVSVEPNTTLFTDIAYELQFATVTEVRVSETAEYVAELNKTDLFTSAATAHTKKLSYSPDGFSSVSSGQGFPLSLADSALYNLTTVAARRSAMCLALRNLGNKPFFVFHVTFAYPDKAVERLGLEKTLVMDIPVYADIDSLSVSTTGVELDTKEIVF